MRCTSVGVLAADARTAARVLHAAELPLVPASAWPILCRYGIKRRDTPDRSIRRHREPVPAPTPAGLMVTATNVMTGRAVRTTSAQSSSATSERGQDAHSLASQNPPCWEQATTKEADVRRYAARCQHSPTMDLASIMALRLFLS